MAFKLGVRRAPKQFVGVRLPLNLRNIVVECAVKERRSTSQMAMILIEEAVLERVRKGK